MSAELALFNGLFAGCILGYVLGFYVRGLIKPINRSNDGKSDA